MSPRSCLVSPSVSVVGVMTSSPGRLPDVIRTRAAINSAGSNEGVGFHFHAENHGKLLQIVIFDCFEISRFAIVSRDFLRENEIPRLYYCQRN